MAVSGTYISDVNLLAQLDDVVRSSATELSNIDHMVSDYLNDVRDNLERQLDIINQNLQAAEMRLENARVALEACHAVQVFVPELGLVPDCLCEETELNNAQQEADKWRYRYGRGQQILSQSLQEINDYACGGHRLVSDVVHNHQPAISHFLSENQAKIWEMLNANLEVTTISTQASSTLLGTDSSSESLSAPVRHTFQPAALPNLQSPHSRSTQTPASSRCPRCGRPYLLCTCNAV